MQRAAEAPAKPAAAPPAFPDDWREQMSGGDADTIEMLKRYNTPVDAAKAMAEQRRTLSRGKAADVPMPDPKANPDAAKAWREERGIPADATGYEIPADVQKDLTDADKPVLEDFTTFAHENNMPATEVGKTVKWYTAWAAQQAATRAAEDQKLAEKTEDALREEWGRDFKPFSAAAARFANEIAPGTNWFTARLPDGRRLGDIPEFTKAFADLAVLKWGDVSFVGGEQRQAAAGRLQELETEMKQNGELPPEKRTEMFKLLEAAENAKAKAG